jgi:hypothetical protein
MDKENLYTKIKNKINKIKRLETNRKQILAQHQNIEIDDIIEKDKEIIKKLIYENKNIYDEFEEKEKKEIENELNDINFEMKKLESDIIKINEMIKEMNQIISTNDIILNKIEEKTENSINIMNKVENFLWEMK